MWCQRVVTILNRKQSLQKQNWMGCSRFSLNWTTRKYLYHLLSIGEQELFWTKLKLKFWLKNYIKKKTFFCGTGLETFLPPPKNQLHTIFHVFPKMFRGARVNKTWGRKILLLFLEEGLQDEAKFKGNFSCFLKIVLRGARVNKSCRQFLIS